MIFFAIYLPVIRLEEQFLRSQFPGFDEYARRVPRLLPKLRAADGPRGEFSFDLYWKHREYNAALGAAAVLAVLISKLLWWSS